AGRLESRTDLQVLDRDRDASGHSRRRGRGAHEDLWTARRPDSYRAQTRRGGAHRGPSRLIQSSARSNSAARTVVVRPRGTKTICACDDSKSPSIAASTMWIPPETPVKR